jgi:hypothetical protein
MRLVVQGYRVVIEFLTHRYTWDIVKLFLTELQELRECGMEFSLDSITIQTLFHTWVSTRKTSGSVRETKKAKPTGNLFDLCQTK